MASKGRPHNTNSKTNSTSSAAQHFCPLLLLSDPQGEDGKQRQFNVCVWGRGVAAADWLVGVCFREERAAGAC